MRNTLLTPLLLLLAALTLPLAALAATVQLEDYPETPPSQTGRLPLNASVSLDRAMTDERHIDWHAWYLNARQRIITMGGLPCPQGTQIVFYKDGGVVAATTEDACRQQVARLNLPFPPGSRLWRIYLNVRPADAPPLTPAQLPNQ